MAEEQDRARGRDDERCGTCRFWKYRERDADDDEDFADGDYLALADGVCRRNPPQPNQARMIAMALQETQDEDHALESIGEAGIFAVIDGIWPATESDDWCGEYRPLDGAPLAADARTPATADPSGG